VRTTLQRFVDDVDPLEDELEEGISHWALGDDEDDNDVFETWDADDDLTNGWLDEQLARVNDADSETSPAAIADDQRDSEPTGDGVVLRRSAPLRHRRRRADRDAVADLPALNVPGYVRDRRGTWRYAATGRAVPGARDLTLRSLHRFPVGQGQVQVPVDLVRSEAELGWCMGWKHTLTTRLHGRRSLAVLRVPVGEWERRADVPFGLWAPELTASRLLGIGDVARLAGVSPATITAYLSRRRMPEPVMRLGNTPVWSRPVIRQWLAARPGQGRRTAG
jgi:predicted DNA-binding transcriptional regulator AlpA